MNLKKTGWWIFCLLTSIVVLLIFASRTSPFYSLLMGDYGVNSSAAAMLVGKYWIQGTVPYRDLFILEAPVYLLIQAAGWIFAGRTGILILEIVCFTAFLIFMQKLLALFISEKKAALCTFFALVPYAAFCCGGNSSVEWCLPFISAGLHLVIKMLKNGCISGQWMMITGILCGFIFMISSGSGALLYGAVIYLLWHCFRGHSSRFFVEKLGLLMLGIVIPVVPVVVYFLTVHGFVPMLQGTVLYPVKEIVSDISSITVLLHKAVKCCLVLPLFFSGVCYGRRKSKTTGDCIALASMASAVSLMLCDNSWYWFIAAIPGIVLAIAVFLSETTFYRKTTGYLAAICGLLLTFLICYVPAKNFLNYLVPGVPEVVEEFCGDFRNFIEKSDECTIVALNTDCSYFLYLNVEPVCRYFTDQEKLSELDSEVKDQVESYVDGSFDADVLITTEHGWVGQDYACYSLVQVYCKKGGNICIYMADY